jgi:peptidoglycan/xylan/chitin deacetylase (PgdA/CDA1 family)
MAVDPDYLDYPLRKRGMDHDHYEFQHHAVRSPIIWPGGARLALWLVPIVEFFPLNMANSPFAVPGGMGRPYPDYWNYTLRDYGNRVGLARIVKILDERRLAASVAFNAQAAERYPYWVAQTVQRGWEVMAHGWDMAHIHRADWDREFEEAIVRRSVDTLRRLSGQPVSGWLSPANALSDNTTHLVATAGCGYTADWVNDDLPYEMATDTGPLWSMPLGYELSDIRLITGYNQRAEAWAEQVIDAFDFLYSETVEKGGRVLALPLPPWVIGVPHRIGQLAAVLDHVTAHDDVWCATGADILAAAKGNDI